MHPVDAVLKRFKQEDDPERRNYFADKHRKFHDTFKEDVFGHPEEFFTRKLILRLIFLYNICHKKAGNEIHFLDPTDSDIEFMTAMNEMYEDMHKAEAADKAVCEARRKLNHAEPEQRVAAESSLVAAETLHMAGIHIHQTKWDFLEWDLRSEENLFPELIKAHVSEPAWKMIQELTDKVQNLLVDVEVPPSPELRAERAELPCKKFQLWDSEFDGQFTFGARVRAAVDSLTEATEMVKDLEQLDVWDILAECRKVLKQAKGKDLIEEKQQYGVFHGPRSGLADAVECFVGIYRRFAAQMGMDIDEKVYAKAAEFIELVESTMEPEFYTRPAPDETMKDEWCTYYELKIADKEDFAVLLRHYARMVLYNAWDFDQRVLEALEVIIEQGKGKVDVEVEDDKSLTLKNIDNWGVQGEISVLIRGYCQMIKEEGRQPDYEILQIAQIIIDQANEQFEEEDEDRDSDHGAHDCTCCKEGLLDENSVARGSSYGRVISCEFGPLEGDVTGVNEKGPHAIDERQRLRTRVMLPHSTMTAIPL
jgi:hypothetical protein